MPEEKYSALKDLEEGVYTFDFSITAKLRAHIHSQVLPDELERLKHEFVKDMMRKTYEQLSEAVIIRPRGKLSWDMIF